ncbi:MetQ/NlpA family ABC transporter substrate-binding protein [Pallidibacillus thermolactis]|uniref:MetQ/NlpA family ABC transporter substrate-binding protein n=1 Tax=Pallidibacillus thermolactis TaxID=251051 RepID=UPI0021D94A7F|nr:MetQ/NlpA family ABC transporter substrate-binding protein [Pallidibacillus thermolactis]MCU9601624.1 MetQ/NlpA family ABC transporter substrate-binding protein [Pallidibacillus thermolactis subsp. kokeshiiformis]
MKKLLTLIFTAFLTVTLAACGGDEGNTSESSNGESKKIVVGATAVPHAEILEQAAPILKEKGIELEITEFSGYELINQALVEGDLDANFFQHIPYLELEKEEKGYDIVNAGGIHIEPIGIYSKKYDKLEDVEDGATVLISSNKPDHGRILALFEKEGLIKLADGVEKGSATLDDIVENPKNLKFDFEYAPEILPQVYNQGEGDLVVINSNYALEFDINPIEDSLAIEEGSQDNPYVNIIAVNAGDEDKEEIKTLVEVLQSKEIQDFILENYDGAVVPASE